MTTLAYRSGVLAADTQGTFGHLAIMRVTKIVRNGPVLAAAAGHASHARRALDWVKAGCVGWPELGDEEANADLTLFLPCGLIVDFCPAGATTTVAEFWANGSGAELALGAMAAGASAEEAVRIACRYDNGSSEPIDVIRR